MHTATTEDYIKQIFMEQQRSAFDFVSMGKVAEALQVSPGTVTTMVKSLAESGLLNYKPRRGVTLTAKGHSLALSMIRRHRIVEVFLVEKLGLDWSEVHQEAERIEHALSDKVLDQLDAFLGHPSKDPHGSPIPDKDGGYDARKRTALSHCSLNTPVTIERIESNRPGFLQYVESQGLILKEKLEVFERNVDASCLTLRLSDGKSLTLSLEAADRIYVDSNKS